jgi:steroid delta-isomerase-like uncharacterized protein
MTPLETIQAYYALFEVASREVLDQVVDDDFVLDDSPIATHVRGKEKLWRIIDRPKRGPSEDSFVVEEYFGDEKRGAARWRWHASGAIAALFGLPVSAEAADSEGVCLVEFRDGKLTKLTEHWDSAAVLRQLGADIPTARHGGLAPTQA